MPSIKPIAELLILRLLLAFFLAWLVLPVRAFHDPGGPLVRLLLWLLWLLSQPLLWAALGLVIGPYMFYRGFRLLQRKRLILDIPRSTIRAAAIGAVEVSGKAVGPYTLVSPLTARDCLYYRVVIRVLRRATPIIDELCAPLFINDGTGDLMIYPEGAEMQWSGQQRDCGEYLDHALGRHGFSREDLVSAEEFCIEPDDPIFVMGTLCENPWATRRTDDSSLSRIGPGFVSLEEADLLRPEAFVAPDPRLRSGAAQGREFNLYPPTILTRGQGPFVISNRSQHEVVAQLAWKSFLFIWGGPAWTVWGLWRILSQAEIWGMLAGVPR